jgi:hypothetical protein
MMKAPTDNEILLAEQRLDQARQEVVASAARLQSEFRATLAKPSTLIGVAVAAGLLGYYLFKPSRRPRRPARRVRARRAEDRTTDETSKSLASIVVAFAMRYAMQRLPAVGMQLLDKTFHKDKDKEKEKVRKEAAAVQAEPLTPTRPAAVTLH